VKSSNLTKLFLDVTNIALWIVMTRSRYGSSPKFQKNIISFRVYAVTILFPEDEGSISLPKAGSSLPQIPSKTMILFADILYLPRESLSMRNSYRQKDNNFDVGGGGA
jgi:hypothetical protein